MARTRTRSRARKMNSSDYSAKDSHGRLNHLPIGSLERIAEKAGVTLSGLSTLTVPFRSSMLYSVVLEYAALCAPLTDPHHPLLVNRCESEYSSSDDESDAGSDAGSDRSGRDAPVSVSEREENADEGPTRFPVPQYRMAFGETSVVWPPPEEIAAAKLREERDQRSLARKEKKEGENGKVLDKVEDGKVNGKKEDVQANGTLEENGDETDCCEVEEEAQATIYVLHYYLGHPDEYREVTLVSADGYKTLQKFATEVLVWQTEKDFYPMDDTRFHLYRYTAGDKYWEHEGRKRGRSPNSVILPKGQLDSILRDVRNFLKPSTRKWYQEHGIPQRRSFLFYGPPGTGKTSTILCIASTFRLNCCFLRMTGTLSDQMLSDALKGCPSRALLVLEDIDTLFNDDRENVSGGLLTFSGLLNSLDGLTSVNGIITIMTTNHIDRLDPALIRGGRVDRRVYFERPNEDQIKDLFSSFYPGASEELRERFLKAVQDFHEGEGEARSIATLQQLFIRERESSAEACVKAVPQFYKEHFPSRAGREKGNLYL